MNYYYVNVRYQLKSSGKNNNYHYNRSWYGYWAKNKAEIKSECRQAIEHSAEAKMVNVKWTIKQYKLS